MSERVKQAEEYCVKYGQDHLLPYMRPAFEDGSARMADQILRCDLKRIRDEMIRWAQEEKISAVHGSSLESNCSPPEVFDLTGACATGRHRYMEAGLISIASGELAVITMAGGQGTRLGHFGPKGTYLLPLDPPQSFFEIQCRGLLRLSRRTSRPIPWLIMTSQENFEATIRYFEKNHYFGYDRSWIRFFKQTMFPVVDFNGKILVHRGDIVMSPDGNGRIFSSLRESKNLEWLREIGVKRLFICGIDNALINMGDPLFVGFAVLNECDIAAKSCEKRGPGERAGIFCERNNQIDYLEYTEIPSQMASKVDSQGNVVFKDIGIGMYIYSLDLAEQLSIVKLPYHDARKSVPYTLPSGEEIIPDNPNAIKFEAFIFDSFKYAKKISVIRVARDQEFAPVKNASGEDSPAEAARLVSRNKRMNEE